MVRIASVLGALFIWVIAGCGEEAKPPVFEPIYNGNSASSAEPEAMNQVDGPSTEPEVVSETPPEMVTPVTSDDGDCFTNESYYEAKVYAPIMNAICSDCHSGIGVAKDTDLVVLPPEAPEAAQRNYQQIEHLARLDYDGAPLLIEKPIGGANHGGGPILAEDDPLLDNLREIIRRVRSGVNPVCESDGEEDFGLTEDVVLLSPESTLRRAMLDLGGRTPTPEEYTLIAEHGWSGFDLVLDDAMTTRSFGMRISELFNDIFLTNKYLGGQRALELLDEESYPNARWMDSGDAMIVSEGDIGLITRSRAHSNDAVAQEPLKLIEYLIVSDRPFTELLTADYIMVSPYSAIIFDAVVENAWDDPNDPDEFQPGRISGFPHAGILSSPMFLNRFPTTETNRNRHRAKVVFDYFLGLDILKFAQRPIDPTSTEHVPTMRDPQCNVCRNVIDPVAGAFQNFDTAGSYLVPEGWYGDMLPPGFGANKIPPEQRWAGLQWLAQEIIKDPRFPKAMVRLFFRGLIGEDILSRPIGTEPGLETLMRRFKSQDAYLERVAKGFKQHNYSARWLIRQIVKGPYYRAVDVHDPSMDESLFEDFGVKDLLTPEQLNRKVIALFGRPWRANPRGQDYLTSAGEFLFFYGGIDSDDVVRRIREPSGIMASVQQRLAVEGSCFFVAADFSRPIEDRILFPWINPTDVPQINETEAPEEDETNVAEDDSDGGPTQEEIETMIDRSIQHLHQHLLGETLEVDDVEFVESKRLLYDVLSHGQMLIADELEPPNLHGSCQVRNDYWTGAELPEAQRVFRDEQYMIRSWMALVSYLMLSPEFLYP